MKRWFLLSVIGTLMLTLFLPFQAAAADFDSVLKEGSSDSDVTMVAEGMGHALALKQDGTVWSWGNNAFGQLGYGGTTIEDDPPVQVQDLDSVVAISTGSDHSLALKSDGTVWAWGSNYLGQLGIGKEGGVSSSPVQVTNLSSVVAIAAGNNHNLAVKSDGTVWSWGQNQFGALGDGSTTARYTPVQVQGLSSVIDVAAGERHSLALKSDGTVWGWGSNESGELGDGSMKNRYTPVQVQGIDSVIDVAAGSSSGYSHSLALKSDGTVWAWGNNYAGKLGDGTTTSRTSPVQVIHLDSVTAIDAGREHSLALKSDGTVWAWGYNDFGQLGDGSSTRSGSSSPVQVQGLGSVISISGGSDQSLALQGDNTVWGWGLHFWPPVTASYTPVQVHGTWQNTPKAPQWPRGDVLTVTDVTYNSVKLNWQPAMDEKGTDKYLVYTQGYTLLATFNGDVTSYEVKGLAPDSHYIFSLVAVDADGNQSEKKEVQVTTSAITTPGTFRLTDSKTYSDGWFNYEYLLYDGYITSPGQVLSGSWTPPEGYHGVVNVSMITADGENYDLSLETVSEGGYPIPRLTTELSDGTEYSGAGLPIGDTAVWKVKGHTDQDYSPDKKVTVYVSIKYDNH
ncbi:hypothetical protein I8J29_02755 [Paenibacillus sp. MWE-103]|uniref:Fibronectin type-III domain-containing protein n=1 Tax=Paenibacillus artemisiicola TaxID=1172618 RepID=A0ABS3W475_9BACL|nr:fibronectin type III domain-containing protein [Paenibacillus artemisiicola]MBO7743100.1 hypothetical protein [Paenibacillus artemisiicola]